MPYNLNLAHWDEKLSDANLSLLFNQLAIINTSKERIIVLHCHYTDLGRVQQAMEDAGYKNCHTITIYKPAQSLRGMDFIYATDIALCGYYPGIQACRLTFPDVNPTMRHNLLFCPNVRSKAIALDGEVINTTQKHPSVSHRLARIFCRPGDTALVIGAGSGSELIGINRAGVNVVGIESDARQVKACATRLLSCAENLPNELERAALED